MTPEPTTATAAAVDRGSELGPLETDVMEIVWREGASNVREVAGRLGRPLAYTTVMTTLDRLYKKGLLDRRKDERAFIYHARVSRPQWLQQRARDFIAGFFQAPESGREVLVSCLLEAVREYDADLLDRLSARIQAAQSANPGPE